MKCVPILLSLILILLEWAWVIIVYFVPMPLLAHEILIDVAETHAVALNAIGYFGEQSCSN